MDDELKQDTRVLELSVTAAVLETALRAIVVLAGSHQRAEICARIYDIGHDALTRLQSSDEQDNG